MLKFSHRTIRHLIKISPYIVSALVFISFIIGGSFYYFRHKNLSDYQKYASDSAIENLPPSEIATPTLSDDQNTAEASAEIKKTPPKTASSGGLKSSAVKTTTGQSAVIVSEGNVSDSDIDNLNAYASAPPVSSFAYTDFTGNYPNLGATLKAYLDSTLYRSDEISYLYEVEIEDCPTCSYGGYWTGSYLINSSGDITRAFGWIRLNVAFYKNSPYFLDYMKLIFSHEYGHHYTMYHRWVSLDLETGQRFPDSYYSTRPLSKNSTAPDYSLGWQNCDAEVIAEDYSYFFSGYGYHAIAPYHGYPSTATLSWLKNIKSASPPDPNSPPVVSISTPAPSAVLSTNFTFSASASDDKAIYKVEFLIDGTLISSDLVSPYSISVNPANYSATSHTLTAVAHDAETTTQTSISVSFASPSAPTDTENPTIEISTPTPSPYSWSAGNQNIEAHATDNLAIQKIELYIENQLVATENADSIYRIWIYDSTPAGSYTLKAKSYDTSGNTAETSVIINKT